MFQAGVTPSARHPVQSPAGPPAFTGSAPARPAPSPAKRPASCGDAPPSPSAAKRSRVPPPPPPPTSGLGRSFSAEWPAQQQQQASPVAAAVTGASLAERLVVKRETVAPPEGPPPDPHTGYPGVMDFKVSHQSLAADDTSGGLSTAVLLGRD